MKYTEVTIKITTEEELNYSIADLIQYECYKYLKKLGITVLSNDAEVQIKNE